MNIPIDERFITTSEASEVLQIDEQYRFRLKEFETVSAELSENLERLSQEVKSLEEDYREKVDRFGLFDRATKQAQTEFYTMLRALEIMRGDTNERAV